MLSESSKLGNSIDISTGRLIIKGNSNIINHRNFLNAF